MIGWQNTRNALGKLEELLTCKICANLVSDPCSLEACDHIFCRNCVEKLVGADSKCPECGAFAWVKDMKTNHQLANTISMCTKIRMLVGSDDKDDDNVESKTHINTSSNEVVWEETQATFDQATDSYHFSSPEVIASAKLINKCDAAIQEISHNNRSRFKKPAVKTYGKSKMRTSTKGKRSDTNMADNGTEKNDKKLSVKKTPDQDGEKILVCRNGKLLEKGTVVSSSNSKADKRIQAKEKCFGKQLKTRRAGTTVSLFTSSCGDQENENKEENDQQLIDSSTNLQFGAEEEDNSLTEVEKEKFDGESFTRVKSRPEQSEGTPIEADNVPKTRAQKRKVQGTQVRPTKAVPQVQETGIDTSARMVNDKQKKVLKNTTGTPVKQGSNKRKILGENFCSPQSSASGSPGVKRNKRGETPLHVAAIKGCVETVRKLLADGADPNTKDHAGWTPLHEACNHGYLSIAKLLLDHGAMIDIPGGFDHDSPLHDAVTNGRLEVARLLVSRGAPLDIRNKRGLLPMDYAATEVMRSMLSTSSPNKDSGSTTLVSSVPLSGKCSQDTPKVLLATGLTSEQKATLQSCARTLSAKIVSEFSLSVTHIVTATNTKGVCPRTIKYLNGVLTGKWIVNYEWIAKSLRRKAWLDEVPYEIKGTNDASVEAPKRARINALKQLPGLFDGCQFYFYGEFCPPHPPKEDLIQLIKYGGGKILSREPKPDVDETLCLPTTHKVNRAPNQAVTLASVAYHAKPESKLYRCTQYVIYDPLTDKKPHIWDTDSVRTMPLTWLMDCASNFAILDSE